MLIAADRSWLPAAPGFIGSNLAHRLVEIGDVEVTLLDSMEKDQGEMSSMLTTSRIGSAAWNAS
jgi:hypothetical protein